MILVFGKTGQVAQELGKFKNVVTLDRSQADLAYPKTCKAAIYSYKPAAVINAAAYTAVDQAEEDEILAKTVNGVAPGEISRACADLNIPFVHISSDYVFEGTGYHMWKTSDPTKPQNAYGRSKLLGELAIKNFGSTYAILRTSWLVSEHGKNFLKTMLQISKNCDVIKVVDDQIGGPTPAHEVAKACIKITYDLLEDPKKIGVYHFSGTPDVSWCDFANIIFNKAGCQTVALPIPTSEYPVKSKRPLNSRLDCSKTEEKFNIFRPNWIEGLEKILRGLKEDEKA